MHATLPMLTLTSDEVGCRWSSVFCSEPHGPWVTQNEFCYTTKTVGGTGAVLGFICKSTLMPRVPPLSWQSCLMNEIPKHTWLYLVICALIANG